MSSCSGPNCNHSSHRRNPNYDRKAIMDDYDLDDELVQDFRKEVVEPARRRRQKNLQPKRIRNRNEFRKRERRNRRKGRR